jgi:hypothetical protein
MVISNSKTTAVGYSGIHYRWYTVHVPRGILEKSAALCEYETDVATILASNSGPHIMKSRPMKKFE